ncbi:MAG: hypothetical protein E7373_00345 [Clostridiales bacterium]|jgi:hypothetical protein|nr:hypothetical protein [Clostridiales bacterium]
MEKNEYNEKAINDVYKNAHIALQSISDLLPSVEDEDIKAELKDEYEGYEKVIGEVSTFMAENGIEPKDVNPFKKAMLWSSIKMKTLFDNSRNQVAEMMINGTVMGINELTAMKNEQTNLDPGVLELLEKLLKLEEEYEQRLKKYL